VVAEFLSPKNVLNKKKVLPPTHIERKRAK